jgi:hypothetical protein
LRREFLAGPFELVTRLAEFDGGKREIYAEP